MYLIPGLYKDLHNQVEGVLNIDLKELKEELRDKLEWTVDDNADKDECFTPLNSDNSLHSRTVGRRGGDSSTDPNNGSAQSAEGNQGSSELQDGEDETQACDDSTQHSIADKEPPGFLHGIGGSAPIYTDGKFWNYVDDSLDQLCKRVQKEVGDHGCEVELELYLRYRLV